MYVNVEPPTSTPFGRLIAWDPVSQKEAWRQEHVSPWNGGTLTTAGNLVFQGTADGRFIAYDATKGTKLWETPDRHRRGGGPVTYVVDGRQYVSIAAGWGGVYGIMHRATNRRGPGTVYTFALGGSAQPPAFVEYQQGALVQGVPYDPAHVKEGTAPLRQQLRVLPRCPRRGPRRQREEPRLSSAAVVGNMGPFVYRGPAWPSACPTSPARSRRTSSRRSRPSSRARRTRYVRSEDSPAADQPVQMLAEVGVVLVAAEQARLRGRRRRRAPAAGYVRTCPSSSRSGARPSVPARSAAR